jgi:hypothetical protein
MPGELLMSQTGGLTILRAGVKPGLQPLKMPETGSISSINLKSPKAIFTLAALTLEP